MIGKTIDGYRIIKEIGIGGMGTVYLAHLINNENNEKYQRVAIKFLHRHLTKSKHVKERFIQEAETQAKLQHKNITRFISFNENESGLYIIMEYLEGNTLDKYIAVERGLIPEKEAKRLFLEIVEAVKYAHGKKIVHRDLKPSNIMITANGNVKVMDFGIAKVIDFDKYLTKTGSKLGSPVYMSPEQVLGKNVDYRTDIYSLGIIYFEMLTGNPVFDKNDITEFEIYNRIINNQIPRLKNYYELITNNAQRIIDLATAKNPDNRYQSVVELEHDLRNENETESAKLQYKNIGIYFIIALFVTAIIIMGFQVYKKTFSDKLANFQLSNSFANDKSIDKNLSELSSILYDEKFNSGTIFHEFENSYGIYKNNSLYAEIISKSGREEFHHIERIDNLDTSQGFTILSKIRFASCNNALNNGGCALGFLIGDTNRSVNLFSDGYLALTESSEVDQKVMVDNSYKFQRFFEFGKEISVRIQYQNNTLQIYLDNKNYLNSSLSNGMGNTFGFKVQEGATIELLEYKIFDNKK